MADGVVTLSDGVSGILPAPASSGSSIDQGAAGDRRGTLPTETGAGRGTVRSVAWRIVLVATS